MQRRRFPGGGEERRGRGPEGIAKALAGPAVRQVTPDDIEYAVTNFVVERLSDQMKRPRVDSSSGADWLLPKRPLSSPAIPADRPRSRRCRAPKGIS